MPVGYFFRPRHSEALREKVEVFALAEKVPTGAYLRPVRPPPHFPPPLLLLLLYHRPVRGGWPNVAGLVAAHGLRAHLERQEDGSQAALQHLATHPATRYAPWSS